MSTPLTPAFVAGELGGTGSVAYCPVAGQETIDLLGYGAWTFDVWPVAGVIDLDHCRFCRIESCCDCRSDNRRGNELIVGA